MFDLNTLSLNLITNFFFTLKDVNTEYYTTSVPKASQNATFFLRTERVKIVCRQPACNNHAVKFTFNISILQYINDFSFWITVRLTPFKLCLQIGLVYQPSMADQLLARESKNISDKRDTVPLYKTQMHCAGTELGPSGTEGAG